MAWNTAGKVGGFARVISHVGSFTNIRGGHNYPWLIRNTPRKPIARVFLQGGANDLNNQVPKPKPFPPRGSALSGGCFGQHGSWPLANQQMALALEYAGCKSLPPAVLLFPLYPP